MLHTVQFASSAAVHMQSSCKLLVPGCVVVAFGIAERQCLCQCIKQASFYLCQELPKLFNLVSGGSRVVMLHHVIVQQLALLSIVHMCYMLLIE